MKIRFYLILLALTLLLIPNAALAQAPVTLTVEAGLDGYYKIGQWLPVRVLLQVLAAGCPSDRAHRSPGRRMPG